MCQALLLAQRIQQGANKTPTCPHAPNSLTGSVLWAERDFRFHSIFNRWAVLTANSWLLFSALFEKNSRVKTCLLVPQSGCGRVQPSPRPPPRPPPIHIHFLRVYIRTMLLQQVKGTSKPADAQSPAWLCSSRVAGIHTASWTLEENEGKFSFQELFSDQSLSDHNHLGWKLAVFLCKTTGQRTGRQMRVRSVEAVFFKAYHLYVFCWLQRKLLLWLCIGTRNRTYRFALVHL